MCRFIHKLNAATAVSLLMLALSSIAVLRTMAVSDAYSRHVGVVPTPDLPQPDLLMRFGGYFIKSTSLIVAHFTGSPGVTHWNPAVQCLLWLSVIVFSCLTGVVIAWILGHLRGVGKRL